MKGGVLGIGCDDAQLIAATCTRTKKQLARTIKRYRAMYDRDLRDEAPQHLWTPHPTCFHSSSRVQFSTSGMLCL